MNSIKPSPTTPTNIKPPIYTALKLLCIAPMCLCTGALLLVVGVICAEIILMGIPTIPAQPYLTDLTEQIKQPSDTSQHIAPVSTKQESPAITLQRNSENQILIPEDMITALPSTESFTATSENGQITSALIMESPPPRTNLYLQTVAPIELHIRRPDWFILSETLRQDVIRHGGHIVSGSHKSREWTFAVSHAYLARIEPLANASGAKGIGKAYRAWAQEVQANPKDAASAGKPYNSVTVRFTKFLFATAVTKWLAIAAAVMFGCFFLLTPVLLIMFKLLPDHLVSAIRGDT